MSRIGKYPIAVPEGVQVNISDKNVVSIKGKQGELHQNIDPAIRVKLEDNQIVLERQSELKDHKANHCLYRALLDNMLKGVTEGYTIVQELVGVGYKVTVSGQLLEMALGFSHNIYFELPPEVKAEAKTERGKAPVLTLKSIDKQLLGQVAAKIRSLRKPEPYKGKGIKYQGEILRKKAGKAAAE
ncbi:MAG: 50S ribosomal protein L6 [Bacteroidales bacterium]|nr:50S ribosomal protein L6 [Bacteroidales bacterium]